MASAVLSNSQNMVRGQIECIERLNTPVGIPSRRNTGV
jgi:hypothetical protein